MCPQFGIINETRNFQRYFKSFKEISTSWINQGFALLGNKRSPFDDALIDHLTQALSDKSFYWSLKLRITTDALLLPCDINFISGACISNIMWRYNVSYRLIAFLFAVFRAGFIYLRHLTRPATGSAGRCRDTPGLVERPITTPTTGTSARSPRRMCKVSSKVQPCYNKLVFVVTGGRLWSEVVQRK